MLSGVKYEIKEEETLSIVENSFNNHSSSQKLVEEFLNAVREGELPKIVTLLQQGVPIDVKDNHDKSAVLLAAANGQLQVLKLLVKQPGASLDEENIAGYTPLLYAAQYGHQMVVRWLIDHHVSLIKKNYDGSNALLLAVANNHAAIVELLLNEFVLRKEKNNDINSALLLAAQNGSLEIMQMIYRHGTYLMYKGYKDKNCLIYMDKDTDPPFLLAAKNGHINILQWLIEEVGYCCTTAADTSGKTAMLLAAQNGQLEIIIFLFEHLKKYSLLEQKDHQGNSLLLLAAENGHVHIIKWLFNNKPSFKIINEKNNYGATAVLLAAANGQLPVLRFLHKENGALLNGRDDDGRSALILAARNNDISIIDYLLNHGSCLNEEDKFGYTAPMLAGHYHVMAYLLQYGISSDNKHLFIQNTFLKAAAKGDEKIINWFYDNVLSSQENDQLNNIALLCACIQGHLRMMQLLHEKGASLATKDENNNTLLMIASRMCHLDIIKWLIRKGSDLHEKNNKGITALIMSAIAGNLEITQWLIHEGANIKDKANCGGTPLLMAAFYGHLEIVSWLLSNGSSIDERNNLGRTAILLAASHGELEVIKFFNDHYNSYTLFNEIDNQMNTPLILATFENHKEVVIWLLANNKADIDDKNIFGKTALHYANKPKMKIILASFKEQRKISALKTIEELENQEFTGILQLMRKNNHTKFGFNLLYSTEILNVLLIPTQCNFSNWGMLDIDIHYRKHYTSHLAHLFAKVGEFYLHSMSNTYLLPVQYDELYTLPNLKLAMWTNYEIFNILARTQQTRKTFIELLKSKSFLSVLSANQEILSTVINQLSCEVEDWDFLLKIIELWSDKNSSIARLDIRIALVNFVFILLDTWHENIEIPCKTKTAMKMIGLTKNDLDKLFTISAVQEFFTGYSLQNFLDDPQKMLSHFVAHLCCDEANWSLVSYLLNTKLTILSDVNFDDLLKRYVPKLLEAFDESESTVDALFISLFTDLLACEKFICFTMAIDNYHFYGKVKNAQETMEKRAKASSQCYSDYDLIDDDHLPFQEYCEASLLTIETKPAGTYFNSGRYSHAELLNNFGIMNLSTERESSLSISSNEEEEVAALLAEEMNEDYIKVSSYIS